MHAEAGFLHGCRRYDLWLPFAYWHGAERSYALTFSRRAVLVGQAER